jgi:hypothetical protein
MARPNEGPYGSNAAIHVHYMRTHALRTGFGVWEKVYWKIEENPLRIFPNGVSSDTTAPIFLNLSDSDPELSYPIDIVDDAATFGKLPCQTWITYCDSESDPENHYDNVNKNRCPWLVRGRVDIWVRAIDFMNAKGTFIKEHTHTFGPFDIYPIVNRIEYDIKDSNGISIFGVPRLLIDFDDYLPVALSP